jgi:cytochrome c553
VKSTRALALSLALVALSAWSCSSPREEAPQKEVTPAAAAPVVAEEPPRIDVEALAMVEHFARARSLREAVIAGELEDLRAPATWLKGEIDAASFPAPWREHVAQVQAAAGVLVTTESIEAAAAEVAAMAGACGACHASLQAGPRLTIPPLPEAVPGTNAHMIRHQWAAERMWEGLVIPSDEAWMLGAAALAEAPLAVEHLTENVELPEEVLAMGERVHALGATGKDARDRAARARIYGEFIAACATCHKGGC